MYKLISSAVLAGVVAAHSSADGEFRTCGTDHDDLEIAAAINVAENTHKAICENPALAGKIRACLPYEERIKQPVEIPVWYHIVHSGATGRLTERQVQAQFEQTNKDFAGLEDPSPNPNPERPPAAMEITFSFAGATYTDNSQWFNDMERYETQVKNAVAVDNTKNFNQYFGGLSQGLLGFCYFPNSFAESSNMHGCINLWSSIPGGSSAPYNEGKTTTHETGHGIGLFHTFQGGCNGQGDQVSDTPNQQSATSGCPIGRDSCRDRSLDPIHNYMDYSFDSCMYEFTKGQSERANLQLSTFRPGLYNSEEEMELIAREMPDAFAEAQTFARFSEERYMQKRLNKGFQN